MNFVNTSKLLPTRTPSNFSSNFKSSQSALMRFPLIVDNSLELIFDKVFYRLNNFLSLKADIFLKLEGFNPAGSIKIKPAIRMLEALEEEGKISPEYNRIIESSSGNLGVAVSLACSIKNQIKEKELTEIYTPTREELNLASQHTRKGATNYSITLDRQRLPRRKITASNQ